MTLSSNPAQEDVVREDIAKQQQNSGITVLTAAIMAIVLAIIAIDLKQPLSFIISSFFPLNYSFFSRISKKNS